MPRFIFNIVIFFCISLFAFGHISGRLFQALDGSFFISKTEIQQSFFDKSLFLHNDLMEGLSSSINDLNLSTKNALLPSQNLKSYAPLFYTYYAILLFLAVLLIAWNYQFPSSIYYLSAWLLPLISFPYFQNFRVYSLSEANPCFYEFIFVFALIDVGIQHMGRSWKQSLGFASITLLGLIYGLIFCPTAFVIIAPILLITTMHAFLKPSQPLERYRKLICCVIILLLSLIFGWAQYAFGLILDSAANVFQNLLTGYYHSKIYASILYIGNFPGSQLGPYLFGGATIGMLFAILISKKLRLLALLILICQLILAGGGAYVMSLEKPWLGPSLIYFEMILFPFYILFSMYFIDLIINKILDLLKFHNISLIKSFLYNLFLFILIINLFKQSSEVVQNNSYTFPPRSTLITDILEHEISLQPNKIFAGRVANILPTKDWLEQCAYFHALDQATGNDHQSFGLWFKHIPTLHTYHQEISPGFFSFYHRLLSMPNKSLYRNWSSFTKIDTKILTLLGVKFLLTTESHLKDLKRRAILKTNNNQIEPLYLYELSNVNVSGISAKEIVQETSISNAENRLATKNFNLSTAIVIDNTILKNIHLVPAIKSELRAVRNGFHLKAYSEGKTFLILPLEFNYCLKITPLTGNMPQIIRVDGILLGVLFDKQIDSILQYQASPFDNPNCKLKNYLEFKKLW